MRDNLKNLNVISSQIIQAAITVHKALGPGLLESVYQTCMVIELGRMGVEVESEVQLPEETIADVFAVG